jgi:5-methylcytosine-specific restriction protein A
MPYPKYSEVADALLKYIYETGGRKCVVIASGTYLPLANYFDLSEEDIAQTRDQIHGDGSSQRWWDVVVQFGRRRLVRNGLLEASLPGMKTGLWKLTEKGQLAAASLAQERWFANFTYPDDVSTEFGEGFSRKVLVNRFERNRSARACCLKHYGHSCSACEINMEKKYGAIGRHYMHVHHIVPISTVGATYQVDPIRDLRPLCPNCHAMVHTSDPPLRIDELIKRIQEASATHHLN